MTDRSPITFQPLTDWTLPPTPRVGSPFRPTWRKVMDLLSREATNLSAPLVTVEVDCAPRDIRRDGFLRADTRLESGRVRVSLVSPTRGALRWAVDRYQAHGLSWLHNLWAIACTLEALRAVDRWGAVHDGEQYTGFLAIEPAATVDFATAEDALDWLREFTASGPGTAPDVVVAAARRRARHDPDDRNRVTSAATLLGSP